MLVTRKLLNNYYNNNNNSGRFNINMIKRCLISSATLPDDDNNNGIIQVEVKQGIVAGLRKQLPNGKSYFTFKGIPYAYPPIGDLRFMPPKPLEKFTTPILDCRKERDVCFHKDIMVANYVGSEDCLYLNVYTPTADNMDNKKLPVMIWIHGGAFMAGSGNSEYYSPEYLLQENVIVITFNYRLGPFGFLYLPKAKVYPNAGLKDQLLVFKWVNENIQRFGGDPDNVTLFGESAGAGCVHLHALSPNSKKYFHKAICQSGCAIMEWLIQPNLEEKTKVLAKLVGCTATDDQEILEYLRNIKDPKTIYEQMFPSLNADEKRRGLPIIFKPAIEPEDSPDAIFTQHPLDVLNNNKNAIEIPMIMGYNSHEGIITFIDVYKKLSIIDRDLGKYIPRTLNIENLEANNNNNNNNSLECQQLVNDMRKLYFNNESITVDKFLGISNLTTDYHFGLLSIIYAELHSRTQQQRAPLYFYTFSFDGDFNYFKKLAFIRLEKLKLDYIKGACHGDDMYYLFNWKMFGSELDENTKSGLVKKQMCKMWTNFAKYGNPTPDVVESPAATSVQSNLPFKWNPVMGGLTDGSDQKPPVDPSCIQFQLDYLNIDQEMKMKINPYEERIRFWRDIFQMFNGNFLKLKL